MSADADPLGWLREHGPRLLAFANQWAGCQADAEDIFQEAFVRFWKSRDGTREPLLYLYRCVRNVAIDWNRAKERRQRLEKQAAVQQLCCPAETSLEQSEMEQSIQEALRKLPANQREVVVLRLWSDLTFDQISKVLWIPTSTAHATYKTAMQALHADMERLQP